MLRGKCFPVPYSVDLVKMLNYEYYSVCYRPLQKAPRKGRVRSFKISWEGPIPDLCPILTGPLGASPRAFIG